MLSSYKYGIERCICLVAGFIMIITTVICGHKTVVSAETPIPNLALTTVSFVDSLDKDNSYIYTGEQIEPKISLYIQAYTMSVPDKSYTYSIVSTDGDGFSAGTNVGAVTIQIIPVSNSICYGEKEATYYIKKSDDLETEDEKIQLGESSEEFDLSSISLSKTDCGERSYSLGELQDENGVLSDVSIHDTMLIYSPSGKKGTAKQEVVIKTNNYEDVIATMTFETSEWVSGDVNDDGVVSIADVVLLQRWLLSVPGITLPNWKAADLYEDEILNTFDLCLLKRSLLEMRVANSSNDEVVEMDRLDKINIIGDAADFISNDVKSVLKDFISENSSNFDFSNISFDFDGRADIPKSANDYLNLIGDTYYFNLYYKGVLLNPEKYQVIVNMYDDGTSTVMADFINEDFMRKLEELSLNPLQTKEEAILIAKEYADGLDIPNDKENDTVLLEFGTFSPSENFGENISLIIYSLEDSSLAYKVCDTDWNYTDVKDYTYVDGTENDDSFVVNLCVYVNAYKGNVMDYVFSTDCIMT